MSGKEDVMKRSKRLVAEVQKSQKGQELLEVLPQGPGSGLHADLLDNLHAEEIIAKAKGVTAGGGGSGGGMQQHGNEYHDPDFAEEAHTHTESEITDLDHDAQKIKGVTVDDAAKGDGKVLVYRTTEDKLQYEEQAGGGGGAPAAATYITKNDETVELPNSVQHVNVLEADKHTPKAHDINPDEGPHTGGLPLAKLEGHDKAAHDALNINAATLEESTKAQVQDHTPKAHTLASHSSKAHSELTGVGTDDHHAMNHGLDHSQHPDVNIGTPTDGQMIIYDAASGKWINADPLVTINREGTPTRINTTGAAEIVAAPGASKKLVLCGFFVSVDADESVQLRWNGATGDIIVELPTKGVVGGNLVGINEISGENQNLYLTKSGSGNARGTVWTKEVAA